MKHSRIARYEILWDSHFEHFVFFLAFDKAKNAHMWRGRLIRIFGTKNLKIGVVFIGIL